MQSMVLTGAPAQYGAAPTMTSMYTSPQTYASPATSMYMPTSTMAAPMTYAAPTVQTVQAAPTYAASTVQTVQAAPTVVETFAAPAAVFAMPAPVSLTQGLTTPAKLESERVAYETALAAQLKKQCDATLAEASIKKQMLQQQADTQKAQYNLQIDEQTKMAQLQIDQQAQSQMCGLKEAAITQQTSREEMAAIAAADYNKKKAMEDYSAKSYQLQKQWFEKETSLTNEYQKVMKAGSRSVVTSAMPQVPAYF